MKKAEDGDYLTTKYPEDAKKDRKGVCRKERIEPKDTRSGDLKPRNAGKGLQPQDGRKYMQMEKRSQNPKRPLPAGFTTRRYSIFGNP